MSGLYEQKLAREKFKGSSDGVSYRCLQIEFSLKKISVVHIIENI